MVTDATEENEVCQLMIWIGLPAMPGRVKGWLVADQPASKYSTQLPPPPVVPQSQTQFQTTATTLLIIFLQSCKYSITKPSLNPPCVVHNAHVFVRHILIQNLLVAVQYLDMKCSIVRMQDLVRADWHRAFQLPLHALPVFPTCSMTFAPNPGFLKCFE